MNAIQKSSKSGCGCGGAGSKSGGCGCGGGQTGLCACGDVGCATCRNQGFVRPRFFAGQLLTEEDLQKLIDYVVAKNRLHNQRLWGDGVVCGLEVTCNPCGGGSVIVNPGYALDCCGNDLLLGCPQELDINAMVRDLKRNLLGGVDCGDPCPPKKKEPKDPKDEQDAANQPGVSKDPALYRLDAQSVDDEPVIDTTRHYCLYIRYCENLTDPVSPYATDEGCSYQSCQPTRVSEGVTFELRCDEGCGHQTDIRERICECIGDLDSAKQSTIWASAFYSLAGLMSAVRNVEHIDHRVAAQNFVKSAEIVRAIALARQPQVAAAKRRTAAAVTTSPAAGTTLTAGSSGTEQPATIDAQEFETWLSDIHTADAHLASWYLVREKASRNEQGLEAVKSTEKEVEDARTVLREVAAKLSEQVSAISAPKLALEYYSSFLKRTVELAASEQPLQQYGEARLLMIMKGSIFERQDLQSSVAPMMTLREELLDRLDRSPRQGDCRLRSDVLAIRLPELETLIGWQKTSGALAEAWGRYLKDCLCAAINPPCGPCDDPAVLLACLEVKDCEVTEICNLKRKFVISPTALRYWLPPLNYLGDLLEKLCCPEPLCEDDDMKLTDPKNQLRGYGRYNPVTSRFRIDPVIFELLCGSLKRGKPATPYTTPKPILTFPRPAAAVPMSLNQLWSVVVSGAQRAFASTAVPLDKPVGEMLRDAVISDKAALTTFIGALEPEVRRAFAAALKSAEGKAAVRAVVTELQPGTKDLAAIGKKVDELSTAVSKEGLNDRVAEAVKAKGGATGTAITSLADASVAAAVQKLNLDSAAKDLQEVKRSMTENAELKKNLTALEVRLKKLEGGKP